jgi:hypothetical protein
MSNEPSGPQWCERFPTSSSVETLIEPFRGKVKRFLAALAAGNATVSISATFRPKQRAYLMHYCYQLANRQISPRAIPPLNGVGIGWVHGSDAESVSAAQSMVTAYEIAYAPVLASRHTQGLAIDMDITWDGDLAMDDGKGRHLAINDEPRDGANAALWGIGVSYGVMKLASDPPHWSSDGH